MEKTYLDIYRDIVEISAKTSLSVIPVGGELMTCVWDSVKSNAAQRRLDERTTDLGSLFVDFITTE